MITTRHEDSYISALPFIGTYFANTFHFVFSLSMIVAFALNYGRVIEFSFQLATISFTIGGLIYALVGSADIESEKDETLSQYLFWIAKRLIEAGFAYIILLTFHTPISTLLPSPLGLNLLNGFVDVEMLAASLWFSLAALSNVIFTESLITLMMFFEGNLDPD